MKYIVGIIGVQFLKSLVFDDLFIQRQKIRDGNPIARFFQAFSRNSLIHCLKVILAAAGIGVARF